MNKSRRTGEKNENYIQVSSHSWCPCRHVLASRFGFSRVSDFLSCNSSSQEDLPMPFETGWLLPALESASLYKLHDVSLLPLVLSGAFVVHICINLAMMFTGKKKKSVKFILKDSFVLPECSLFIFQLVFLVSIERSDKRERQ